MTLQQLGITNVCLASATSTNSEGDEQVLTVSLLHTMAKKTVSDDSRSSIVRVQSPTIFVPQTFGYIKFTFSASCKQQRCLCSNPSTRLRKPPGRTRIVMCVIRLEWSVFGNRNKIHIYIYTRDPRLCAALGAGLTEMERSRQTACGQHCGSATAA